MIKPLTPRFWPFAVLFPPCSRGAYALFDGPASLHHSATCELTTLWLLCVCDDHFSTRRDHLTLKCFCEFSIPWHVLRFARPLLVSSFASPDWQLFLLFAYILLCLAHRPGIRHAVAVHTYDLSLPNDHCCHSMNYCQLLWLNATGLMPESTIDSFRGTSNRVRVSLVLVLGQQPRTSSCHNQPRERQGKALLASRALSTRASRSYSLVVRFDRTSGEKWAHSHVRMEPSVRFGRLPNTTRCYAARTSRTQSSDTEGQSSIPSTRGLPAVLEIVWRSNGNTKGGTLKTSSTTLPVFRQPVRKPTLPTRRPWNADEIRARDKAERALNRAKACAAAGNPQLAISFCLQGLRATWGFTRPFAIRDQITDFMLLVDADGGVRRGGLDKELG
jgi:hypothetical protein